MDNIWRMLNTRRKYVRQVNWSDIIVVTAMVLLLITGFVMSC